MTETMMSLNEAYLTPSGWVIASRLLMKDLVQAFGLAEPHQLAADGKVRTKYFEGGVAWAEDLGMSVTDDLSHD